MNLNLLFTLLSSLFSVRVQVRRATRHNGSQKPGANDELRTSNPEPNVNLNTNREERR